jgi:hypothetical protein
MQAVHTHDLEEWKGDDGDGFRSTRIGSLFGGTVRDVQLHGSGRDASSTKQAVEPQWKREMREQREREQNRVEVEKRKEEAIRAKADEDERRTREARMQYVCVLYFVFVSLRS